MAYCTLSDLTAHLPLAHVLDGCDDTGPGKDLSGKLNVETTAQKQARVQTVLDGILEQASNRVDSYLASRYETPVGEPFPAICAESAIWFAIEILCARKALKVEQVNLTVWGAAVTRTHENLKEVRDGTVQLGSGFVPSRRAGVAITSDATFGSTARL